MIEPKYNRDKTTALKIFVDRENFQEAFLKAINRKPEEKYKVLVYYGVGGIGKTALREHLELKLKEQWPKAISTALNFETSNYRQQDDFLDNLRHSLEKKYKIKFPAYDKAYSVYLCKVSPGSVKTGKEIPFIEEGSKIWEIISTSKEWPYVGQVPKIVITILQVISKLWSWWTKHGDEKLKQLEYMEPSEIQERLPMFWAEDLSNYLKQNNHPVVFFIDTYEALWEMNRTTGHYAARDAWIRELVAQLPLPANVLWVICGREQLRWDEVDRDWSSKKYLAQHPVGNLADSDAKHLLQMRGITDIDLQEAIVRASEGVPFYLDLAIVSYERIRKNTNREPLPADFSGTHNDILERFLRYLDRSEKTVLEVLSAARFWNRKTFDLLLTNFDTGFPREKFFELMSFSFINEEDSPFDEHKYTMHQLMRKNLQEFQNKEDCYKIHKFLFEHYSKLLPMTGTIVITEDQKIALNEAFYHGQIFMGATDFSEWFLRAAKPFADKAQHRILISLYEELVKFTEEFLGRNHLDVAKTINNLASLYYAVGKYDDAETLYVRALKIGEEVLGQNHPCVVKFLNGLALLYNDQGRYDDAETLYVRALKIGEEVLGQNHPDVTTTLNNLAVLYRTKGKYDDAESLYVRALKIKEKFLDANDPDLASTLNNLGVLYFVQGKYDAAESLYVRALKIKERFLDSNHPDLASLFDNLANLYLVQGKYDDAETLYVRALKIREEVLDPNHLDIATTLNNLASLYCAQGKYDDAESLYVRALKIREKALDPKHPDVAGLRNNLANLCHAQGKAVK